MNIVGTDSRMTGCNIIKGNGAYLIETKKDSKKSICTFFFITERIYRKSNFLVRKNILSSYLRGK